MNSIQTFIMNKLKKHYLLQSMVVMIILPLIPVTGQITNDDSYNINVRTTGYRYDPDNQHGTNYITFLLDAAHSVSGSDRCLVDIDDGSGYSHNVTFDYDTPETRTDAQYYRHLLTVGNTDQTYYLTWYAYQDNCSPRLEYEGSCCGFLCLGKEDVGLNYQCRLAQLNAFGTGPVTGSWYQYWRLNSNNVGIRIEHSWRYYQGEGRHRPLTFGTIPPNSNRTHFNLNRKAASGATSGTGYKNNWQSSQHPAFSDGMDVTYSFSIDQLSEVSIFTREITDALDSRLHLLSKNGSSWNYLFSSSALNGSTVQAGMTKILPAGEYFVIVEGDDQDEGRFVLDIQVSEGRTHCSDLTFTFLNGDQIWNVNSARATPDATIDSDQRMIFRVEDFFQLRGGNEIEDQGQLEVFVQPCIDD